MDTEWALNELRDFVLLVADHETRGGDFSAARGQARARNMKITREAQVAEQILDRVLPQWREMVPRNPHNRWEQHREACLRSITELDRAAELREKLGDDAPTLDAGQLHPWVWQGARSLWQSGHYREAVTAAARKLNAETQNKLARRDVSETDLFNQAFSADEPKAGQPRLRLLEDDGGKSALSVRQGLRAYAQGCFAAIRNPASHDVLEELPEHEALEQLAAFSVLARWVERAEILNA